MEQSRVFELAPISDRFIALVIDSILVGIIGGGLGLGGQLWGGGIVSFLIGAAYQWFFLVKQNGQTPGKMLMNIRVIKIDGTPIDDVDAVLRYLGYCLNSAILMIGWLWAIWDPNSQGWHDKLAKTYVVRVTEEKAKRKNDHVVVQK